MYIYLRIPLTQNAEYDTRSIFESSTALFEFRYFLKNFIFLDWLPYQDSKSPVSSAY